MRKILIGIFVLLCSIAAVAQQDYVGRYDVYGGFGYLTSPGLNLAERGFHTQDGINVNSWLSFGFDYSIFQGHSSLKPADLTTNLHNQLYAVGAANGLTQTQVDALRVPYNSTTYTITGGPQLSYRRLKFVTLFIHPSVGAIHENVKARPTDALQTGIVQYFGSTGALSSTGTKSDTTYFYGVGGGIEFNVTKHMHLRMTTDLVRAPLFNGFLKNDVNNIRFSVGPTFNFGKNVAK